MNEKMGQKRGWVISRDNKNKGRGNRFKANIPVGKLVFPYKRLWD